MPRPPPTSTFFFFNDTATPEIYTLSLHDALPISTREGGEGGRVRAVRKTGMRARDADLKSTRLNSSHSQISYAVFCLKKKKKKDKESDEIKQHNGVVQLESLSSVVV